MTDLDPTILDAGVLTVIEAAAILKISRSQMYDMIRRGEILSFRFGTCRRIPKKALVEYAMKCVEGRN